MLEILVAGLIVLAVPLILLGLLLKVAFFALTLPFRVLGLAFEVVAGLLGLVFKVLFGALGVVGVLLGLVLAVLMLPLLPLLLFGAFVWVLVRPARPRRALAAA